MKMTLKRIIAFALVIAMLCGFSIHASAAGVDTKEVGALLDSFTANGDTFALTTASRIFVVSDTAPSGDLLDTVQLAQQQFAAAGRPSTSVLPIVYGPESYVWDGDIVVKLDESADIADEGYELAITASAKVTASDVDGLLYGLNMLLKHMTYAGSNSICGFTAKDEPDTIERTVHLDCGRKYFTKEWICNFIRQISWMGYNSLEFHFSEDGGFRADFWGGSKYYTGDFQPENDFTWICGSLSASWVASKYWKEYENEDYLTTAELIEICETAAEYHIDIIPSFDSPAHVDYLTWIFEQNYNNNTSYSFTYNGTTYNASSVSGCINYSGVTGYTSVAQWPYYSSMNIKSSVAKSFIFALYTDIANFFKEYAGSTKFNIGADEVNLTAVSSPKWSFSDFPGYVNELDNLLNGLGYTTRIFNDFIGTDNSNYTSSGVTIDDFNSDIEILYWNSPFEPRPEGYQYSSENLVQPVSYFTNDKRTLYNVVQTSTYFCTRVTSTGEDGVDARDPAVRRWQIFHAHEDLIYNEWYPGDFGEKGDNSENVIVDSKYIGGAYFCLWFDYQALSTEEKIWKGEDDTGKWNVIDRMWSNTIKMWNWDVNDSASYTQFAEIRETINHFPGYTDCSDQTTLPAATSPAVAYLNDHSELDEALAAKIDSAPYTEASYAIYQAAYDAAVTVNADTAATQEEITSAIEALEAAEKQLVVRGLTVLVQFKGKHSASDRDSDAFDLGSVEYPLESGAYRIYIAPQTGYKFLKASNTTFTANASGDGSGHISGTSQYGVTVTLYYLSTPDTTRLDYLIRNSISDGSVYTDASWTAYQTALTNATNFNVTAGVVQSDIQACISALELAERGLVCESDTTTISVEKLTATAQVGKQIGLRVTTTPDVASLTIFDSAGNAIDMTLCAGKVQTLSSGERVKIWLVHIPAVTAGTAAYMVQGAQVSASVEVTIN